MGAYGLHDICKGSYIWHKMKFIGSVLHFLTVVFSISLCIYYRKIIYATLMAPDEILQVYRTDAA